MIKVKLLLLILFILLQKTLPQNLKPESNEYRYWIIFKDKGIYKPGMVLEKGTEGYNLARANLTEKAIWRRSKVLNEEKIVSYIDLPVNQEYIEKIISLGAKHHAVSKWLNGISIRAKKDLLDKIKQLPFVEKIEGVGYLEFVKLPILKPGNKLPIQENKSQNKYNYGYSYWQNEQIQVPKLHNIGITGYGVTVGMCDDGYNWRHHEALKTRKVLGEYDWIFKDDSVQYQRPPFQVPGDVYDQDGHGTSTMSTLGGFMEGQLIGPAFDVEFYLSKTEDNGSETPVEEDYWLEAAEWMEAMGVEVITSSLIYKPFDPPHNKYTYKDMDGKTTVIVRAAEIASSLGVVVLNSMGNEMQKNPPSIVSPPDGPNVIAVGAVDSTGRIAYFSSNGPTSDGRTKPDVVAMGVDVYCAASYSFTYDSSGYSYANGTSFSCPLTAGVCALILSAHPELTPSQVMTALKMTADRKDNPNNIYGWGLVNAYEAVLYYGLVMSNKPEIKIENDNQIISVYAISKNMILPGSVKMFYSLNGADFKEIEMNLSEKTDENNSGLYTITAPADFINDGVKFYFTASDEKSEKVLPYNAPKRFFYYDNLKKEVNIY